MRIISCCSNKFLCTLCEPEFINRIDEQILFNSLTKENLEKIIEIELKSLHTRIEQAGYSLRLTQGAKKLWPPL